MSAVTVIAEAGVNHNGRLELALALVDAAADAGADVVKFQTFRADHLATRDARRADYQIRNTDKSGGQLEMLRALELGDTAHRQLIAHCNKRGVTFLSTPFDMLSLDLLTEGLGLRRIKVGSGDLTNAPLLLEVARRGRSIILSTGMATMDEVEEALGVLAFGFAGEGEPGRCAFRAAFASAAGKAMLQRNVVLLHCTSEYPAPTDEINLRAMDTLRQTFDLPVGYSDHSDGIVIPIAAAGRGAAVIEKHITLDRALPGPDHLASVEPANFAAMVAGIRQVERALGNGHKAPMPSEMTTMPIARKSIVAHRAIERGERFRPAMLATKRPGTGLSPIRYWDLIGRPASRNYQADEMIAEIESSPRVVPN